MANAHMFVYISLKIMFIIKLLFTHNIPDINVTVNGAKIFDYTMTSEFTILSFMNQTVTEIETWLKVDISPE